MNPWELYLWMNREQPKPFQLRRLYSQLGKELTAEEAWYVVWLHDVKCTGVYGLGFDVFVKELERKKLLPPNY